MLGNMVDPAVVVVVVIVVVLVVVTHPVELPKILIIICSVLFNKTSVLTVTVSSS